MTSGWKLVLRSIAIILAALIGMVVWELGVVLAILHVEPSWISWEEGLYLLDKGGFVLVLALCFTAIRRGWTRYGFTGGVAWRFWPVLLPVWAATVNSGLHGVADETPLELIGWVVLAISIGFGEEAIFRGVILDAVLGSPPVGTPVTAGRARVAIIVSATIFGAAHLVALAMPGLERQVVFAEVLFAGGIGLSLGWVRMRAASIWPGLIAHSALDALGLVAGGGISNTMMSNNGDDMSLWLFSGFTLLWGLALVIFWPAVKQR